MNTDILVVGGGTAGSVIAAALLNVPLLVSRFLKLVPTPDISDQEGGILTCSMSIELAPRRIGVMQDRQRTAVFCVSAGHKREVRAYRTEGNE